MINETIKFLTDEINNYLALKLNIPVTDKRLTAGNISRAFDTDSGSGTDSLTNKAIVSLINMEEDRLSKRQLPHIIVNNRVVYQNPAVHLNLYLLFAANMQNYLESLQLLRYIIQFFQNQHVFNRAQFPAMATEKLVVEMYSISFEQEKNLWGNLGGKSLPSVLYKVKVVPIEENMPYASGEFITDMNLQFPGEGEALPEPPPPPPPSGIGFWTIENDFVVS